MGDVGVIEAGHQLALFLVLLQYAFRILVLRFEEVFMQFLASTYDLFILYLLEKSAFMTAVGEWPKTLMKAILYSIVSQKCVF